MSEEQIIALLTESRDLQKQSAENYKVALQKKPSIYKSSTLPNSRGGLPRQKLVILTVVAITMIAFLIVFPSSVLLKGVNH